MNVVCRASGQGRNLKTISIRSFPPRSSHANRNALRTFTSSSPLPYSDSRSTADPSQGLKDLMRRVAQPVSIITADISPSSTSPSTENHNHGATLSSFTSISLHPLPLVAFSLRLPSRLASFFNQDEPERERKHDHDQTKEGEGEKKFTIHLLSSTQKNLAMSFARQAPSPPTTTPNTPTSPSPTISTIPPIPSFPKHLFDSLDGPETIGSLDCRLVRKVRLDPESLGVVRNDGGDGGGGGGGGESGEVGGAWGTGGKEASSELFIALVEGVRLGPEFEEEGKLEGSGSGSASSPTPSSRSLLYLEQNYFSVGPLEVFEDVPGGRKTDAKGDREGER